METEMAELLVEIDASLIIIIVVLVWIAIGVWRK